MEYFAQVKTVQGATKRYRALAKKWHPDRNGSIDAGAVMAEINRQYKEVLITLNCASRETTKKGSAGGQTEINSACQGKNRTAESNHANLSMREHARIVFVRMVGESELDEIENAARSIVMNIAESAVNFGFGKLKTWIDRKQ